MKKSLCALTERFFSPGALVILALALATTVAVALIPVREPKGIQFWCVAFQQRDSYVDKIEAWNREHPESPFVMTLLHDRSLEQRMLSGFLSGTPVADLLEMHEGVFPKAFLGPVDQIGFLDITERLHAEGLYEQINEPSFSQQISRGRHFGLPHDVHPVLLAYRADIVEAAGIDVSQIETWEDYFRVLRPLMEDRNGDGRPDRYLLNLSEISEDVISMLILQNDGQIFDENDHPIFANERNAETLATITTWITGPQRATIDVPRLSASGHKQMLDGLVIGTTVPDWMLGMWKVENPRLAGKLKLMPLPAFHKGGRRTSVRGGSMIGINKRSAHIEEAWEMAKALYTSAEVAEQTWRKTMILSPVKSLWSEPFYHQPDPFVCGQPSGTLFIEAAPDVPLRPSSPYTNNAYAYITNVAIALRAYAEKNGLYDAEDLKPEALRLLHYYQDQLEKLISRNVFLEEGQ
ncbi:hypothetical protein AXK11_07435 [Cephaloticoccus primus]|uniref:ABC transporter substrate-binding protein n=1 Tax=Cephaloticoccus primus TaxID=1548207 RepID=A0A139SKU4_9BACT|nr:extracellular solute-binding protein [Cephaloticoccus primus]KXU35166.1 hypothetical protein AXK11_07435 [Cephaloticoccus primus]